MYDRATPLPAPIGIFIEADQRWKQLQSDSPHSTPQSKILRTQPLCPNTFHNHNPTTRIRYYSRLQHSHHQLLQKACPFSDTPAFDHYDFLLPRDQIVGLLLDNSLDVEM